MLGLTDCSITLNFGLLAPLPTFLHTVCIAVIQGKKYHQKREHHKEMAWIIQEAVIFTSM
jgi:hypothetical protein